MNEQEWRNKFWLALNAEVFDESPGLNIQSYKIGEYRVATRSMQHDYVMNESRWSEWEWYDPFNEYVIHLEVLQSGMFQLLISANWGMWFRFPTIVGPIFYVGESLHDIHNWPEHYDFNRNGIIKAICKIANIPVWDLHLRSCQESNNEHS